jgi:hypothetical protein
LTFGNIFLETIDKRAGLCYGGVQNIRSGAPAMPNKRRDPTSSEEQKAPAPPTDIDALIADLVEQQRQLAAHLRRTDIADGALAQLFSAYGRNAATLGKLLRDRLALSRKSADDLTAIIHQALSELGEEWGMEL